MKMGAKYLYEKLKTVLKDILTQNAVSHYDFQSNVVTRLHVVVCQTLAGR